MSKNAPWSRNDKIGAASVAIALIAFAFAFFIPEVRQFFGLEKPATTQAPLQNSTSPAPSAVAPSQATPSTPPLKHVTTKAETTVRTTGDSSPAVGSITQGAGSAVSIGQRGGITAGTVNIGTLPPRPLVLTDDQAAFVRSDMEKYSGTNVEVVLVNRTDDTTEFGNRLVSALKDAGWNVSYSSAAMLIRSSGSQSPPGLSLDIGPGSEDIANELSLSLRRHAVIDNKPIPAIRVPKSNKLALYICEPR